MSPRFPLLLLSAVLAGCASHYEVKVDAIARLNAGVDGYSSYQVRPAQSVAGSADFQQAAAYVKTALSGHGLFEAPAGTAPDLIVEVDCGIEPPRVKRETVRVPIYGRVAVTEASALEETTDRQLGRARSEQQATAIIGYREEVRSVVVREKYLWVTGRESRPTVAGKPANDVFDIRVTTEGGGSDLRSQVPVLATAVMEKLGQTTNGIVPASLSANAGSVAFIQRGL